MERITKPQIAKIHVLLSNLGITEQKAEIVYNLSNGRTESTKDLNIDEARRLIISLTGYDPNERQKGLIFSLAYQAGVIYGSTPEDKKMNVAKLNLFLRERGAVKKPLDQMIYKELVQTHRQFEAIVKCMKKSTDNKAANNAVIQLLNELNVQTA
jgi:hypothetical protein